MTDQALNQKDPQPLPVRVHSFLVGALLRVETARLLWSRAHVLVSDEARHVRGDDSARVRDLQQNVAGLPVSWCPTDQY
jgi:hypothetical protein